MSEIQGIPSPSTSPPQSIPTPSSSSPKIPSIATLKSWLPLYLEKTDSSLLHLSRILSTPSGTDTFLLLICYTTLTTSSLLTTASLRQLRTSLTKIVNAAITLPPNTTILLNTSLPPPRLLRLAKSLKALSSLISDFRIFARLWGLVGIYGWVRSVWLGEEKDGILKRIAWAQVLVNVAFQSLENGAYLASKGVLGWDRKMQEKAWLWSCRFWAAHVGLDLFRLVYLRRRGKGDGEKEEEVELEGWWREMVVNLAWAPMTMHWSLEGGLLSELGVGALGSFVGIIKMNRLWKATA